MGNMIEVCILTDFFDDFEKNPQALIDAIKEGAFYYRGPHNFSAHGKWKFGTLTEEQRAEMRKALNEAIP